MNTEPAQGKRVKMVVPRMEQAIPQGWKGYSKDASYRWEEVPSRKPAEDLGRPGSTGVSPGDLGQGWGAEGTVRAGGLGRLCHLYLLGGSLQLVILHDLPRRLKLARSISGA